MHYREQLSYAKERNTHFGGLLGDAIKPRSIFMMKYTLILALISFSFDLSAQEIITDRPDQTESSTTIPFKSFQIESGILVGNSEIDNSSERVLLIPTTLLRYSLKKIIEIRFVEQLVSIRNKKTFNEKFGLSDFEIGTKIQILRRENINTEIAFISHLLIPAGSKSLTTNYWGSINKIAVSHIINNNMNLGYNAGYNYFGKGSGDLTYSLTIGIGLSNKAGGYFETFGEFSDFNKWVSNFDSGITYLLQKNLQLDFSFGIGLNQRMNYFAIGFSWNIDAKP